MKYTYKVKINPNRFKHNDLCGMIEQQYADQNEPQCTLVTLDGQNQLFKFVNIDGEFMIISIDDPIIDITDIKVYNIYINTVHPIDGYEKLTEVKSIKLEAVKMFEKENIQLLKVGN